MTKLGRGGSSPLLGTNKIKMIDNLPKTLLINEKSFLVDYEIISKRTSSARLVNGGVKIKLSRFVRAGDRDKLVEKFLKWAEKRLAKAKDGHFYEPTYEDGGTVTTHNKIYQIKLKSIVGTRDRAVLKDDFLIEVSLKSVNTKGLKYLVEDAIMRDQVNYLGEVLDELNQLYFQEKSFTYRYKRVGSRFGSCSTKRNINIAYRLLFAPREVFRYVCVHELAHLKEFNHSARFWSWVESAMPNYKDSEKWLSSNGFLL